MLADTSVCVLRHQQGQGGDYPHQKARGRFHVSSFIAFHFFFSRQGVLLSSKLTNWLDCLATVSHCSPVSSSQALALQAHLATPVFGQSAEHPNLGHYACLASTIHLHLPSLSAGFLIFTFTLFLVQIIRFLGSLIFLEGANYLSKVA